MANKAISELPQAQNVNNQDLFVLEQSGIAKKLTAETFITEQGIINALAEALDGHGGIQSVTLSSVSGRIRTYLITFTDQSATTFQVLDGTSIDRIAKTSTAGLVDTYTVFMTDGTTSFFNVTNGAAAVDPTLSLADYAAEAKATGDVVDKAKDLIAIQTSTNKWNPDDATADYVVSNASATLGELVAGSGYTTSGFIPAGYGDTVHWYYTTNDLTSMAIGPSCFRIAEYDEDYSCLTVSSNWASLPYTVSNSQTAFVRISVITKAYNMIIVNDDSIIQKAYIAYSVDYNLLSEVAKVINPAEVILPSNFYGVSGQQINIYKENLMLDNRLKSLAYIHTRMPNDATQDDGRTIWNPSADSLTSASYNWEIFRYGLKEPETKSITVNTVPADTGNDTIKVLIIGDSKVANGYVSYYFLHNFDDDDMTCTLLGTQYDWSEANRNEGYGGKTAQWICTNSSSPFCYNGAFSFSDYLTDKSIDTPDFVFINFGTNDCASFSGSNTTYITNFTSAVEEMITSIHAVSSSINVIVSLCEGVCTDWDTNNSEFLKWDLNQKISMLHKYTISAFDNRQDENIYVCPIYMGMDLKNDYNMTEVALSERDSDLSTGKTRYQITDKVHQSRVGYWKNADYMYAIVKYIVAKSLA